MEEGDIERFGIKILKRNLKFRRQGVYVTRKKVRIPIDQYIIYVYYGGWDQRENYTQTRLI